LGAQSTKKVQVFTLLKWCVFAALIAFAVVLFPWPKPPAKVELLPFSDNPPGWDGSQPHLLISILDAENSVRYASAIAMVQPTVRHEKPVNEFDVDLHNGRFILRQTDLFVPDVMPLSLTRTYIAWDYHSRAFGVGTNHPYDICPTGARYPYTYQDLNLEDGYQVHMPRISKGTGYENAVFRHSDTASEFFGAQDAWNGNGWTFTFRDGRKMYFPEAYMAKNLAQGAATEMLDAQGKRIELKRDQLRNLQELISSGGKKINFRYDNNDRIVEALDEVGNVRRYTYDQTGHVVTVSDASRVLYRLEYAPLMRDAGYDPWMLTHILEGNFNVLLENKYLWGRVIEQKLSDGEVFRFDYQLNGREVLQTAVTLPSGETRVFVFRDGKLVQ
jgi:YD repeat-containing protein